jgi:hypothetical protein
LAVRFWNPSFSVLCCRSIFRLPLESSAPGACRFVSSCCGWCSSALSHLSLPVDFLLGNLVYSAPRFPSDFRPGHCFVSAAKERTLDLWSVLLRTRACVFWISTSVWFGFTASDFCFQSRTPDPALRCSAPPICFSLFSCSSMSLCVDFCRDLVSSVSSSVKEIGRIQKIRSLATPLENLVKFDRNSFWAQKE